MTMYCGERDPDEIEIHDNAYILDDDEAEEATTPKDAIPEDWFYLFASIECQLFILVMWKDLFRLNYT